MLQLPLLSMYCGVEIGPQFLNGQRVNAKDPADGKASLVKCFTLYKPAFDPDLQDGANDAPVGSAVPFR